MKKSNKLICILLLILEIILFYLIIFAKTNYTHIFSFVSIAIACLFALIFSRPSNTTFFLNLGLISTVIADLFLVLLSPQNKLLGMILFAITQIIYFLYLYSIENSNKIKLANIISRIIAIVLIEIITIAVLKEKTDALSLISMFYITNLFINIIFAFLNKQTLFFAIGLCLFIFCDIIIGLQVAVTSYITLAEDSFIFKILNAPINIAWLFYLPSQTIISLYIINNSNRKRHSIAVQPKTDIRKKV